jgi:hypothetical protein
MRALENKRLDVELGVSLGPVIPLSDPLSAVAWISEKFAQIQMTVKHISAALHSGPERAFGQPGQSGDIYRIIHLASKITDGYSEALDWTLEFHRLAVEPELERLMNVVSSFSTNILNEIELFSENLYGRLHQAIANHSPGDVVNITLTLTAPDTDGFERELKALARRYTR